VQQAGEMAGPFGQVDVKSSCPNEDGAWGFVRRLEGLWVTMVCCFRIMFVALRVAEVNRLAEHPSDHYIVNEGGHYCLVAEWTVSQSFLLSSPYVTSRLVKTRIR